MGGGWASARRWAVAIGAVITVGALAACSSSGGSSSTTTAASSAASASTSAATCQQVAADANQVLDAANADNGELTSVGPATGDVPSILSLTPGTPIDCAATWGGAPATFVGYWHGSGRPDDQTAGVGYVNAAENQLSNIGYQGDIPNGTAPATYTDPNSCHEVTIVPGKNATTLIEACIDAGSGGVSSASSSTSSVPVATGTDNIGTLLETSGQGNSALATFTFGSLQTPDQATADLSGCGVDLTQALAVRMDVNVTLKSSLPTSALLALQAQWWSDGDMPPAYLLLELSDGAQCDQDGGHVNWSSLQPGASVDVTAWWVFPQQVTPKHPHGDLAQLGQLILQTGISFGDGGDQKGHDTWGGARYIRCGANATSPSELNTAMDGFVIAGTRPTKLTYTVPGGEDTAACR
jgi:hypothetical protein